MRRGIAFMELPNPPVDGEAFNVKAIANVLGIPIRFNEYATHIAMAHGLWWNRYIEVGPGFLLLDHRTAYAIALHEAAHCKRWHKEQRGIAFLLLATPLFLLPWRLAASIILIMVLFMLVEEWFARQELEADEFAVSKGYGVELLRWVMKHPGNPPFYPSFERRCRAIENEKGKHESLP